MRGAWSAFLTLSLISAVFASAVLVLLRGELLLLIPAVLLLPTIIISMMVNSVKRMAMNEEKAIASESPRMIACITMNMQSRPNLERAITSASGMDNGPLARRLRDLRWNVLTRDKKDMVGALLSFNSLLTESNQGLRQSLHLVISADFEKTRDGLERLLDKANQVVLDGMREAVDRYASSLSTPTMVLFSMGIILPVMLFAILPLASMGSLISEPSGLASSGVFDEWSLGVLLLLVFPCFCFVYAHSILSRSPIRGSGGLEFSPAPLMIMQISLWVALMILVSTLSLGIYGSYLFLAVVALPPCLFLLIKLRNGWNRGRARRVESEFSNALYQIGNRMVTGTCFETALEETAISMEESSFSDYAKNVLHLLRISREGMASLVARRDLIGVHSPLVESAMNAVAEASRVDPRAAGKVALNLAQNMSDLRKGEARVEERLRGVIDMMRSTALIFAPLVLGITSSLFELIGAQTGQSLGAMDVIIILVGIYLLELGLIVSYFTTFLLGEGDWREVGIQFATRAPVSIALFVVTSLFSLNGMMALI